MNLECRGQDKALEELSIVVLSYNRKDELLSNLAALCKYSAVYGFELIVVDNNSTDGTRENLAQMRAKYPSLCVINNETNKGVAGGRNSGWLIATRPFILNIDDDTRIKEEGLTRLLEVAKKNERVGVISPRIIHAVSGKPQCDHGDKERQIANFHGACHLIRREVYQQIGEIDNDCSFGGEELDYSIRVRKIGYDVIYSPVVTVLHNNHERLGNEGMWRRRQWVYNFTRVFFKHFPVRMASLLALRYFVSHYVSAYKAIGGGFALSLSISLVKGAVSGYRAYSPLPVSVISFYQDPDLKPRFGNKPIMKLSIFNKFKLG